MKQEHWTIEDLRRHQNDFGERRGSRGNSIIKTEDGTFQSAGELRRWYVLKMEFIHHRISDLERQRPFDIHVNGVYVCTWYADFVYKRDGIEIVEDYKGWHEPIFGLKRKLVEALYSITILVTGPNKKRKTKSKAQLELERKAKDQQDARLEIAKKQMRQRRR